MDGNNNGQYEQISETTISFQLAVFPVNQSGTPDSAASPSPNQMEGYPPCVVCKDVGNGFHYGAFVCYGCFQFFKTAIKNNPVYICAAEGNCRIIRRYTRCKACRLEKCLQMGMESPTVILDHIKNTFETLAFPYLNGVLEWARGVTFFAELCDLEKKQLLLSQWPSLLLLEISRPGSGLHCFTDDEKIYQFLSWLREFGVTTSELVTLKIVVLFMKKKEISRDRYKYTHKSQFDKSIRLLNCCSFARQDRFTWVRRIVTFLKVWVPATAPCVKDLLEAKIPEIFDMIVQAS